MEKSGSGTATECSLSLADITSPSQLQEVTLDQDVTTFSKLYKEIMNFENIYCGFNRCRTVDDYNLHPCFKCYGNFHSSKNCDKKTFGICSDTMGLRSPGGIMRGRSVKEYDEQLTNLRKENFNLKLRIYFLEEKMGTNFTLDKDNVVKKNIELQVEVENLKKEVEEKRQLLCEAVKAMELEDEEHKKYINIKEEELNICQQELDDLRMQLQDTKFDSDGLSLKSDTTGFYSNRALNSAGLVNELQEKVKMLETELHCEKENNASLQLVIGQTETLRTRYDNLVKETHNKDEVIKHLHEEIEAANDKIMNFAEQLKDFQDKLDASYKENQHLQKQVQSENKRFDFVMQQMNDVKKKYASSKAELEREQKRAERLKLVNEAKIGELENDNAKYQERIRELQAKLDATMVEMRKNQNLAVSKSLVQKSNTSHTDVNSISVSHTATPAGTPKKNPLHVPIESPSQSDVPMSPPKLDCSSYNDLEGFLQDSGNDKILSQFQTFKTENANLKQKLIKLKEHNFKACEIIRSLMDSKTKVTEENTQLKADIAQLRTHNKELESELESVVSKPACEGDGLPLQQIVASKNIKALHSSDEKSMAESEAEDLEIAEHYKALINELEAKVEVLIATLNEKDSQMHKLRNQYEEILKSLEDKENRVVDLEFELLSTNPDSSRTVEKSDSKSEKHSSFYRKEIEQKDKEIERLGVELKKCTCYLQEIVNKELWDKNKEIEKLHNRQANSPEIMKLKKDLTGKENQLRILKEKISELGLDINMASEESFEAKELRSPSKNVQHIKSLQEQLKASKEERDTFKQKLDEIKSKNYTVVVERLKSENEVLRESIKKSEILRNDSNNVCSLLNTRLEELAVFLDSLLKHKSILGFLGIQKERRLREIINTSLDLSKSFTMSMINPDKSLAQLSNITTLLNGSVFQDITFDQPPDDEHEDSQAVLSIIPDNITLTYQSHLLKQGRDTEPKKEDVILALREQIVNLKTQLQLRDNELNRLNNSTPRDVSDKTTETEAEANNRSISGFLDISKLFVTPTKCNTTSTTLKQQSECQSESESWSEPDRVVSRARIGLSQTLPTTLKEKTDVFSESTEEESIRSTTPSKRCWYDKRHCLVELNQHISELQQEVEKKSEQLLAAEANLVNVVNREAFDDLERKFKDTEARLIDAEAKKSEAELLVESLQKNVTELSITKKYLEETMSKKDKETQNVINQLQVEKDNASKLVNELKNEASEANKQLKEAEIKLLEMRDEMFEIEKNLRVEYEQFTVLKLRDAEGEFLKKLKHVEEKSEETLSRLRDEYNRDYVRKDEIETKVGQLESELDDLKNIVNSCEQTIETYKVREKDYKNKMSEYQEKIGNLRKELDSITLQYSEAVLEKTKLSNEKTSLEQELSHYRIRDVELKQQISDIRAEFDTANENRQMQIASLQKQKSKLEVRISELEFANAELQNKFLRSQAGGGFNSSLPNIGSRTLPLQSYKRQYSDQPYSSEDNVDDHDNYNFNRTTCPNLSNDLERQEANSSPDLGIESDHGRFSSLETQPNIPRPLLQTIELTESMSNLLDGDSPIKNSGCATEHCCQRSMEVSNENNVLKRKLLRMRRVLEDTVNELNLANQRKKQVEKTICTQIHKTSQVLRKAKANLDSSS